MLLECASPACDPWRLLDLTSTVNWPRLCRLAEEHGVLGHLAFRLHELDKNSVPQEVRETLLEQHRAQALSTLRLSAELFRILELFAERNIPSLVVKGPVLSTRAYADPAIRNYGDLDLLVRQRDMRRATECMLASGYEAAVPVSAIDVGKIPGQYLFSKPEAGVIVELHNDYTLRYFPRRLPLDKCFDRRSLVCIDAHEIPALAVEHELVYICVHGATHFWGRLSWMADVAALVTRQADIRWQGVEDFAKAVEAECMLHIGLLLASDLLHAHLPDRVLAAVQKDAGADKLAASVCRWLNTGLKTPPTIFERAAFRLRMRGSWSSALGYLLRLSLCPTEEDWQADGEVNDNRMLDHLRRPFRLAQKHRRGSKS